MGGLRFYRPAGRGAEREAQVEAYGEGVQGPVIMKLGKSIFLQDGITIGVKELLIYGIHCVHLTKPVLLMFFGKEKIWKY